MSSVIDDYEPLEVIGNGSFGVIRKVKRRSDGQLFARKELNFERMSDRDRKQIVAEVNILKDLKHENIVCYINRYVHQESKILYILMEYCGGGDLGSLINNHRRQNRGLPEDQIWNLFTQILLALNHCHWPNIQLNVADPDASHIDINIGNPKQQILHRDLKPENVFLSSDRVIKLGDFGLAKQIATASFASTYVGTPYYMSPELMSEKAYDTKSDIWSLGCLLFELCALNAPFHDAQTYNELATAIRSGRIPPIPKGYSPALQTIIKGMLNINPAMRPSTLQLLKVEQVVFAYKLIDVNKLITDVRFKQEALQARESTLVLREKALVEREQAMEALHKDLVALETRLKGESEGIAFESSQLDLERAVVEKAANDMAQERTHFDQQVALARDAYREFSEEKEAHQRAKAEWENEVLSRMAKVPLDDVKNKPSKPISFPKSRYADNDEDTPTKVSREIYTVSGPQDDTLPKNSNSKPYLSSAPPLPPQGPRAPGIQRSKPHPHHMNTAPPRPSNQNETPKRLTPSISMADIGSAMKGVVLTDSGVAVPTPARKYSNESNTAGLHGDSATSSAEATDYPDTTDTQEESSSSYEDVVSSKHVVARTRTARRRSIAQPIPASSSRPGIPASITTSLISRVHQQGGVDKGSLSSNSGGVTAAVSSSLPPPPVWDFTDEENLPSPFIKRSTDFTTYTREQSSSGSGSASGEGKYGVGSDPKPVPPHVRSISVPSTRTGRPSLISRAVKASGEAQKALARRQAETQPTM